MFTFCMMDCEQGQYELKWAKNSEQTTSLLERTPTKDYCDEIGAKIKRNEKDWLYSYGIQYLQWFIVKISHKYSRYLKCCLLFAGCCLLYCYSFGWM